MPSLLQIFEKGMEDFEQRGFREVVAELISSAQEVSSLAQSSETETQVFNDLALFMDKLVPILSDLKENVEIMEHRPVHEAVESLGKQFDQAKALVIASRGSKTSAKNIENHVHGLGRSLGLVLLASLEVCPDFKDKIGELHRDLISSRVDQSSVASSSQHSEIEEEEVDQEIGKEKIGLGVEDVVLKLKYGDEEELKLAVFGLSELIGEDKVGLGSDWIDSEGVIPVLFTRLGSSKSEFRLIMIHLLRILASKSVQNKEKMAEEAFLSTLVRSLTREEEERREAVGLLLELSEISAVRRRIGRIKGCIVMLVALLNGDEDPIASRDAGNLLHCLSSNTQNALHMAEAGHFKPIVQFLKEGSDMSKILMATALSRMELTDQSRASLGEDGAIEPLVRMFATGKLEAKFSALNALQSLSILPENVQRLIKSGILSPLLQLLFSVTSAQMTLREPASAILARIAESETVLLNHDVAQQMLSLLNFSSPAIQIHLLQALNSVVSNSSSSKIRRKMKENCAIQLLLPFLPENNAKIRSSALNLLFSLAKDLTQELSEQIGEAQITRIIGIALSSTTTVSEKAAAIGILSCFPISDKKLTELLKRENLLPVIASLTSSIFASTSPETKSLQESIAGVLIRFTIPSDKGLQLYSAEHGVIPLLVKLLSSESMAAKARAANSLSQMSQNSLSMKKSRAPKWLCVPPSSSSNAFCEVHDGYCSVKSTFCLVKAGAVPALLEILEGEGREADEAVLGALGTLLQGEIWENGSNFLAKMMRVQAIVKVLESGSTKAQEKALWILEKMFRVEEHRARFGESAQVVLIDLAQQGDSSLKSMIAKLLAQLELLQAQSSYF